MIGLIGAFAILVGGAIAEWQDQKAEKERKEWADEMDRMEAQFKETMSMANRSPVTYSPEFHKQMDELAKAIAEDIKNGKEA